MSRVLHVWWDGKLVGRLTQDRHGELGFAYSDDWLLDDDARPLSASLPKREEPFSRRECRPFFGGLLPEDSQRDAAARALGVSSANEFALLDRLGGDVAGALQLLPPGEAQRAPNFHRLPEALDEAGLIGVLDALPSRPLLAGNEGLRLSLAGAQSKLPVVLVDGEIALPVSGQPTTHILKPPIARFPGTTENEAFVMRLAAEIGLDVASAAPRAIGNREFLLVERYDRLAGADGRIRRIHQEDFCQALAVPPELKYAGEGGPTLPKAAFAALTATVSACRSTHYEQSLPWDDKGARAAHRRQLRALHGADGRVARAHGARARPLHRGLRRQCRPGTDRSRPTLPHRGLSLQGGSAGQVLRPLPYYPGARR